MLDSMAMEKAKKHMEYAYADAFEILPGVIPKIIKKISNFTEIPIIAGGLIEDQNDTYTALSSGASAISGGTRLAKRELNSPSSNTATG